MIKIKQFLSIGFLSTILSTQAYGLDKKCSGTRWVLKKQAAKKTLIKGRDKIRDFFLNKNEISWCGKKGVIDSLSKYKYIAGTKYTNIKEENINLSADGTIKINLKKDKRSRSTLILSKCKDSKRKCSPLVDIRKLYNELKSKIKEVAKGRQAAFGGGHQPAITKISLAQKIKSSPYANLIRDEMLLEGSIPFYSLRVLDQRTTMGGDWTCAYHSIKNSLSLLMVENLAKDSGFKNNHIRDLKLYLQDTPSFLNSFVGNGGSLRRPRQNSWLQSASTLSVNFIDNDGLFPQDQRLLLTAMKEGRASSYRDFSQRSLSKITQNQLQLSSLGSTLGREEIIPYDDLLPLIKKIKRFQEGKTKSLALTVGQAGEFHYGLALGRPHFITLAVRSLENKKLEVFVLDSLNSGVRSSEAQARGLLNWILDFETKAMDQYRGVFANEADDGSLTVFKIPDQAPIDKYIRQVKSHKPVDGSYHSELNALIHIQKARNTLAILSQLPKIKNSWLITQYDILNKLLKLMRTKLKGSHMLEVRRGTLSNISVKDFTKGLIPVTTQKGFHSLLGKWIKEINTKITTLRLRLRR